MTLRVSYLINDLGAAVACFFATLLAMAALRPVAVAVELVDKPGGRKTHHGEIPVVGGLAMFIGCIFGVGLLPFSQFVSASLLSAAALVVLVGLLDDRFEISPIARLTAHLVAAVLVYHSATEAIVARLSTYCLMRCVGTPMARAASTNSRERSDSVWPRTTRAMSIHENAVIVSTTR